MKKMLRMSDADVPMGKGRIRFFFFFFNRLALKRIFNIVQ